jgi:ferredoxin
MAAKCGAAADYHERMTVRGAAPTVFQALLLPSRQAFDAPADRALLAAAAAAGIELASSCRNGTCRSCLTRLRSGQVHYRIPWPGLLPEEKASGAWVLPCVAFPLSDVVLGEDAAATQ